MTEEKKVKLIRYKVTNFRSVKDSGWIECSDVTTLVGINEAGKSNLLLALWKLNPAKDGEIDPLHDLPIKIYSTERDHLSDIIFITADFELSPVEASKISKMANCSVDEASIARVVRYFDGKYAVSFPEFGSKTDIDASEIILYLQQANNRLEYSEEVTKGESGIKAEAITAVAAASSYIEGKSRLNKNDFDSLKTLLNLKTKAASRSQVEPIIEEIKTKIKDAFAPLFINPPQEVAGVEDQILDNIPTFVYYSNYGNLDSQIYLPHAVKWLKGEHIPGIENQAKVRTLRVLFDFVHLNPTEVLELGKDPKLLAIERKGQNANYEPTAKEVEEAAEQKTKRSILLQSASTDLTQRFRHWWKQGSYIFRFEADGEYFKIWVSDDKRPEEVELEKRSTGLQWFLSFYLVFLVESQNKHKDAVLLLDEAGLSLHPLAQKDLITFFDSLSENNQLIHTTHSPFLVDTNNIERVKVVFVDDEGYTVVSSNLRAANDKLNEKSIYAVHAALGLSVSDVLLQGCRSIIVEGASDQHYFNAIKIFLIRAGKIMPKEELVFMPSGGVRGVPGIVSIISGKDEQLPIVILDADKSGEDAKRKLESGLYKGQAEKLLTVNLFSDVEYAEVEDLIPIKLMERFLDKVLFRDVDDEFFSDVYDPNKAIVNQIQNFAKKYDITLPTGWKVELAKSVKVQLQKADIEKIPSEIVEHWTGLFQKLCE